MLNVQTVFEIRAFFNNLVVVFFMLFAFIIMLLLFFVLKTAHKKTERAFEYLKSLFKKFVFCDTVWKSI